MKTRTTRNGIPFMSQAEEDGYDAGYRDAMSVQDDIRDRIRKYQHLPATPDTARRMLADVRDLLAEDAVVVVPLADPCKVVLMATRKWDALGQVGQADYRLLAP